MTPPAFGQSRWQGSEQGEEVIKNRLYYWSVGLFSGDMRNLKALFNWCTEWNIGDGNSISYWFDNWNGKPRASESDTTIRQRRISLRQAWPIQLTLQPNRPIQQQVQFTEGDDMLQWKWNKTCLFTTKSAYRILTEEGMTRWHFAKIWKGRIPPTVRIFSYLLLQGKTLTRDVLRRRGIQVDRKCVMCSNCPIESALHLFYLCPYSVEVWFHVGQMLNQQLMKPGLTVEIIWETSWNMVRSTGQMSNMDWISRFLCVAWHIWKKKEHSHFRGWVDTTKDSCGEMYTRDEHLAQVLLRCIILDRQWLFVLYLLL